MKIKALIIAAAGLASVALPGAASAQNYGYGQGYYGQPRYGYDGRFEPRYGERFDRFDRHARWDWEKRRRWEEKHRRHEWERAHRHGDRYERDDDRDYYRY